MSETYRDPRTIARCAAVWDAQQQAAAATAVENASKLATHQAAIAAVGVALAAYHGQRQHAAHARRSARAAKQAARAAGGKPASVPAPPAAR